MTQFCIRNATLSDLEDLYQLSKLVFFINLPADKAIISEKIAKSLKAFKKPSSRLWENDYLFVLEDLQEKKVIGASLIHAQHGTLESPHFFLKIGEEEKYSETLNKSFTHKTLKLGIDSDGPTEIGGLVIHPDYRGVPEKLGKQLSFCRFLFMAQFPLRFKSVIHTELMPPLDDEGHSLLWEAIGRRFLDMDYLTADELSRKNKEFILSLYPASTIYQTLLPKQTAATIGQVADETIPAREMLKKIGFKFTQEVDPFDGGPHYRCDLRNIKPVTEYLSQKIIYQDLAQSDFTGRYLISIRSKTYEWFCFSSLAKATEDSLIIPKKAIEHLPINTASDFGHFFPL